MSTTRVRIHFESASRPCGFCAKLVTGQWHVLDHLGLSRCQEKPPHYVFQHAQCFTVDQLNEDPELTSLGHETVTLAPTAAVDTADAVQDLQTALTAVRDSLLDWTLLRTTVEGDLVQYSFACALQTDE